MLISFVLVQLFSCSKKKDYLEMIPSDTDFVIQINPKSIAEKADFNNIKQYQLINSFVSTLEESDPSLKELVLKIKESPNSAGVDIISPVYIFGKKVNHKVITSLIMNMNNKSDFEEQLKTIYKATYKKDINFIDENGYTFIEGSKKPFIAWNKQQFIFIAGEYGTKNKTLNSYFNELIKNDKPLIKNLTFAEFIKRSEDINLWYNGKFFNYLFKVNKDNIDLSNCSWTNYISFNNNNISFIQEFHPDPQAKVFFSQHPLWKRRINTDFYKYVPAKSYLNFSFALYPQNINTIFNVNESITNQLNEYNIDLELLKNSAEGDVIFSIFELDKSQSFNVNNYFKHKDSFKSYDIIPQFVCISKMKNDDFINEIIKNFGEKIKKQGEYYSINLGVNKNLYFAYKNKLAYITNNYTQVNQFISNKIEKNNFLKSEYAGEAKHAMFFNANLNLDDYSDDTKNYIYNQIPLGQTPLVQNFLNQFSKLNFTITDEFTKKGIITLKNQNQNSLETILKFLDQAYVLYTNPQMESYESN